MKLGPLFSAAVCLSLLACCADSARAQTVITFDDIPLNNGTGVFLANDYDGLVWSNFAVVDGILAPNNNPFPVNTNGSYYGVVSPSNVAILAFDGPSEISSLGTNSNFLSAYLTGDWMSNLNIEVQGFRDTNLVYDQTVVASATNPTLFIFNYSDIDSLYFSSSGGQPAFGGIISEQIIMDDFMFESVPEPSSLLLTALAAVPLVPFLRRKRR